MLQFSQSGVLTGKRVLKFYSKYQVGAISYGYDKLVKSMEESNLITLVGKASILQYWGNTGGGGYPNQIGVGDSDAVPTDNTVVALQGSNTAFLTVSGRVYVDAAKTLYISVNFDYSEANFTWKETGVKDNLGILISRQVLAVIDQFTKDTTLRIVVEWQYTVT